MNEEQVAGIVERQREHFRSNATLPLEARRQALRALLDAVRAHEDDIVAALAADLGKSRDESYMCEIGLSLSEIRHQLSHMARWMRPRRHATDLANAVASSRTVRVPYGVTLVMAPWNYPFLLTLEPLAGALAAGNTVVVKPSAYSPASSAVLRAICEDAFRPELVSVVEGGRAENAALLDQRWDYVFFTGSVAVGRLVMERAAANLTPVTLELGGKSPCIVDATANLRVAAARIAFGKWLNVGQTCVAPDYLLVDGYNVIFAWDELKKIAAENLDAARRRLMDILCNYAGYRKCVPILVFDAYRVKGAGREQETWHNLHVIYTREAETADMFIERATHELAKNHRVRVVSSDGAEQIIILGNGALRVSARAFEREVRAVEAEIREFLDQ